MTLRSATEADFPTILALNQASVHVLSPLDRSRLLHLHANSALHLVVETDNAVNAFMLAFREGADYDSPNYRWFQSHYDRFLYVDRVVVAQSLRGQGIGKRLYEQVFEAARGMRLPCVTCEFDLDPPNPASAAFHATFGFQEVGRHSVANGKKEVSLQASRLPSDSQTP